MGLQLGEERERERERASQSQSRRSVHCFYNTYIPCLAAIGHLTSTLSRQPGKGAWCNPMWVESVKGKTVVDIQPGPIPRYNVHVCTIGGCMY